MEESARDAERWMLFTPPSYLKLTDLAKVAVYNPLHGTSGSYQQISRQTQIDLQHQLQLQLQLRIAIQTWPQQYT
jgi:hypothetical protein